MSTYGEYTTVNAVRSQYLGTVGTTDDALILDMIRDAARRIDRISGRQFYPAIETRYYDAVCDVSGNLLRLNRDLLAVTTLTNGDANVIAAASYVFEPRNVSPRWGIRLLASTGLSWQYTTDPENAITIAGVWGYHNDYASGWLDTTATLAAAITTTSATSFTCTTGKLFAGDLIKIGAEYMYVSAVTTSATDTITVVRGVNGSTAATALISTAIYRWDTDKNVQRLCCEAVAGLYRLRENPVGETIVINGATFSTPRDINQYVANNLSEYGLILQ